MAEPSALTRYRPAALAVAGLAAAYSIYLLYITRSSTPVKTNLHRSNAVHRARGERLRPRVELSAPDSEAPLGRLTLRRGNSVLVSNLAQLRFPSMDQISTTFGPQFAVQVYQESISIGLNSILLTCLRARSAESRQMLARIGLHGLPEAVVAHDEERCRAILVAAMPNVPEALIDQALPCVDGGDAALGHDAQLVTQEIAETEFTSSPQDPPADQGIKGLLYYIAEEDSKREAYEHRGITCEECGELPIRGVRWHCLNCPDYDLCATCEAHSVHERTHVFVKIKIPLPVMSQPEETRPLYYPGKSVASQQSLDAGTRKRLAQQYGSTEHKLDALYDQFICVANVEWADDPANIGVAIDMRAFVKAMAPPSWETHCALNIVYESMFAFYDTNKDEVIGFVELVEGMSYLRGPQRFSPLSRALKCFDIDNDGLVDRRDIMRILEAKSTLDRQMTRDAVSRDEQEKTEAGFNTLGPSQPISSIFHEEEIPQGEDRQMTDKRLNRFNDMELRPGCKAILDDTDPWPQQESQRHYVRLADLMPSHERLRQFSSRFEEMLYSPPDEGPRAGVDTEIPSRDSASTSLPASDQTSTGDESSGSPANHEAGILSDVLLRHVAVGLDQLLDPIFLFKERQFADAKASREDRRRWRADIDEYVNEKEAFQAELRSLSQIDPLLATSVSSTGRLARKRRPSRQPEQALEPAFRGGIVPTDAESLARREREIAEQPLEALLSATGYSIIDSNETRPSPLINGDGTLVPAPLDISLSSSSDPTLPQNRPHGASPKVMGERPSKRRMEEYLQHDEAEREAAQRGGPGKLTLDELESILGADRTQSLRSLLLGWLELASF